MAGYSAIMTLFVCGVTMSHYTFHNISEQAQKGSVMTINTLGHAAEAFLFIYLGIGIYTTDQQTFNLKLTLLIIAAGFVARAFSVFLPIGIYACFKKFKLTINFKQMLIIWFSGLIRGAIAFALALKVSPEIAQHKNQLVSLTLVIVLMTTIIFGGLMAAFAKLIGLSVESNTESHDYIARATALDKLEKSKKKSKEDKEVTWFQAKWRTIDDKFLKKLFGGDQNKKRDRKSSSNKHNTSHQSAKFGNDSHDSGHSSNRQTQIDKFAEIAKGRSDEDGEKYTPVKFDK